MGELHDKLHIAGFNFTGSTYDDIVYAMHSAGQANAWCGAAFVPI